MNITRLLSLGLLSATLLWLVSAILHVETVPSATTTVAENAESIKEAATNALKNKDWANALPLLDRYLQLKPDDADFHRKKGSVLRKLGRNEEAIASSQRAVKLAPSSSDNWDDLCRAQILITGAFVTARTSCEKAVALGSTDMFTTFNLGHTYLLQEDPTTAYEWYQKALVNIESYDDLKKALSYFEFFIAKDWQVKESVQAKTWLAKEGALWLERSEPVRKLLVAADAAEKKGDTAQAIVLHEERLPLLIALVGEDHLRTGISLNDLAVLYYNQGQYTQAEPLFKRVLAIRERALGPDHLDVAISLNNLALMIYATQGQYAQAEPLLKRVLAIREKYLDPNHHDIAMSLNKLAVLYYNQGQYTQAEPLFKRALAINEKSLGPDNHEVILSLNDLGTLYLIQSQYAEAEPLYKRALAICEKSLIPDNHDVFLSLNNLAMLYKTQGQYAEAEPLLKRALVITEKALGPDDPDVAVSLNNLAVLYATQGQYAEAEPLLKRALAINEKSLDPDNPYVAANLNNLAYLGNTPGQAESFYKRALAIMEKAHGPYHHDVAVSLINLADLYKNQGQYAQAEPLYLRAGRIAETAGVPEIAWTAQSSLFDFYSKSKPELAIWYGKQAVNTLQAVRAVNTGLNQDAQKFFLKENESIYQGLADLLFTQGRLMEGQQELAMFKESEYFDFIKRSTADDPRKTTASYTNREKPWSERYDTISSQLAAISKEYQALSKRDGASLTAAEKTRMAKLDADLTIGRQAYDDFMVELQREFSQTTDMKRQQEFGKKDLDGLSGLYGTLQDLGHGAVAIHYLMTDKRLWILLTLPSESQIMHESAISEADLNRQIGEYREAIKNRDPKVKELGKALYDLIIGPVSEDLKQAGAQTLMLSLDGAMRYLPMAALYDGEKFLVERYRLATYTEAAKTELKDKPQAQWKFAGFGLTDKIEGYAELKSVRKELEGIAADAMEGDVKFNKDFTAASFKSALAKSPPVVHLSSHFVFKPGTEDDSFLLLGDGNKLSIKQIKDGGYRFTNVDLVTLSACETAVGGGKDENGREVEGLGALAQKQGAKGVLATLWEVEDQSTGQFMQLFYGLRQKNPGMTKAEAMQKAQLAFIKGQVGPALAEVSRGVRHDAQGEQIARVTTTDHPYFWAPFILMGNWL
jgi:CHAT domain-containing protein/tetratricopeptide (TPR) repeat protein